MGIWICKQFDFTIFAGKLKQNALHSPRVSYKRAGDAKRERMGQALPQGRRHVVARV